MAWQILNVHLEDPDAVAGRNEDDRDLVLQILNDEWEPFSTAAMGSGIVVSFRKQGAEATFEASHHGVYL